MKVKSLNEFVNNSVNESSDIDGFLDGLSSEVINAGGYFYRGDDSGSYGMEDGYIFAISKIPLMPTQVSQMFDTGRPAPNTEMFLIDIGSDVNRQVKGMASKIKRLGLKVDLNSLIKTYM
jgi:hypothetical protein